MNKNEKVVKKRIAVKRINKLTENVFSNLFDVTLFSLYLPLVSFGKKPSSRDVHKTFNEAYELLEEINYKKLKHSLIVLKRKGFVKSLKDWVDKPIITAAGKKRLKEIMPRYYVKRPWDKKLYLISYDFEIKQNRIRDLFREYIRRLGAIKLQGSLYLMFNNPYELIKNFKKEHEIKGTILISELGREGFLGKENLKNFIWEASGLEKINLRYREFIEKYKNNKKTSLLKISLAYYSILKNDPQLPFQVLKNEYLGDEAYLLFKKFKKLQK